MIPKKQVAISIEAAKGALEQALKDLEQVADLDWNTVRYALHTQGNYLNIINACLGLIRVHVKDHPEIDVESLLSGLERTTDLMAHLIRHLSHASAAREVPLLHEEVNLARMARRACDFYQPTAEHKRIELICEVEEPLGSVRGDRVAVATVIDNLLSNALKFSPSDRRVWVRVRAEPGCLTCEVRDEGPGLSAEDQARLFREGQRLTPAPTGGEPSAGYGLAISRDLVTRMGGTIRCQSEPGQGATFSFSLPALAPPAP
jgi:signal transduction histidine kinase